MEQLRFNDGSGPFPPIANGCWTFAGGHGAVDLNKAIAVATQHAEAGFTAFDTADIYGPSEQILGDFRRSWLASGHTQPLQLWTKFVPNIFRMKPTPSLVRSSVERSLANLGVDKLDLVQMHWWDYSIPGMVDSAKALAELQAEGKIAAVATTNMDTAALASIVDAGVKVVANQVQFSLLDRRPLNGMVAYCKQHDIKLLTYGSLGGGLLSDRYIAEVGDGKGSDSGITLPWQQPNRVKAPALTTSSLKMYWRVVNEFGGAALWQELLQALRGVATKHGVSVANVALRWVMDQGPVVPIVGMRNASHIDDNRRVLALRLDDADRAAIDAVLAKATGPAGDCYSFERS